VEDNPDNIEFRALRGFVSVRAGDSTIARRDAEWLEQLDRPYLRGSNTFWRSVIIGALGNHDEAVALIHQAFSEGREYMWWMPVTMEFSALRDNPEFQELMRPKG
jgi:hypothetical protein